MLFTHPYELKPEQSPLYASSTIFVIGDAPFGVIVITCELFVAINLNQTSSSAVVPPTHRANVCVAAIVVPEVVLEQLASVFTMTVVAPAQSLLAGCAYETIEIKHKNEMNRIRFMILQGLFGCCKSRMTVLTHL